MNKVYLVDPEKYYGGWNLVAAENAEEACNIIRAFQEQDPNNRLDSWGYSMVAEWDEIPDLYSPIKGIIYDHIYYNGF